MEAQDLTRRIIRSLHRREPLQACLAAAGVMSAWPLAMSSPLGGQNRDRPEHGGILRVRGALRHCLGTGFPAVSHLCHRLLVERGPRQ